MKTNVDLVQPRPIHHLLQWKGVGGGGVKLVLTLQNSQTVVLPGDPVSVLLLQTSDVSCRRNRSNFRSRTILFQEILISAAWRRKCGCWFSCHVISLTVRNVCDGFRFLFSFVFLWIKRAGGRDRLAASRLWVWVPGLISFCVEYACSLCSCVSIAPRKRFSSLMRWFFRRNILAFPRKHGSAHNAKTCIWSQLGILKESLGVSVRSNDCFSVHAALTPADPCNLKFRRKWGEKTSEWMRRRSLLIRPDRCINANGHVMETSEKIETVQVMWPEYSLCPSLFSRLVCHKTFFPLALIHKTTKTPQACVKLEHELQEIVLSYVLFSWNPWCKFLCDVQ